MYPSAIMDCDRVIDRQVARTPENHCFCHPTEGRDAQKLAVLGLISKGRV